MHEDAIIIFLSSCSPVNSKGPAPLIVTTLSDMVYPSFVVGEVKETVTVDWVMVNKEIINVNKII